MKVEIEKIDKGLPTPKYKYHGDAGMDIYSATSCTITPGKWKVIPSGLRFAVPYGFEMQIRPRSGLAAKHGISMVNTPGTLDHQYRGELKIILINHGDESFDVRKGDRIAQVVFNKIEIVHLEEVEFLEETDRGAGGLGSTGIRD